MKLLIVRHGDPNYELDTLTEKGWREAELLSRRLSGLDVKAFYVSPLGRAQDTASLTLKKMGRTAVTCDWLREFPARIHRPDLPDTLSIAWDWLPADWMKEEDFFRYDRWTEPEVFREAGVGELYRSVTEQFDALLARHGYEREGKGYRAVRPNNDTLVFICHFGLQCVLLGHLLSLSPMLLWHSFCAAPTSVTTVITEERQKGKAVFRLNGFGDISHLNSAGEPPAFSARFCECYDNEGEPQNYYENTFPKG